MDQLEKENAPSNCFFSIQEKFQAHVQILKDRREKLLGLKMAEEGRSLNFLVRIHPWAVVSFSLFSLLVILLATAMDVETEDVPRPKITSPWSFACADWECLHCGKVRVVGTATIIS